MKSQIQLSTLILLITFTVLVPNSKQLKLTEVDFDHLDKVSEPVIGIVTIPTSEKLKLQMGEDYSAYVPSSYKKWVEQTGAIPVVIPHFLGMAKIKKIMDQINGVLFPGGAPGLIE